MPTVNIEPSDDFPLPYDLSPQMPETFEERLVSASATAELLLELGAPVEVDTTTLKEETKLIDAVVRERKTEPLKTLPTALGAAAFLRAYGSAMSVDVNQVRTALTQKLLEIANCGDVKYELKAIELLGKHSDIGLFTERSEININYRSPESLEAAIKERVQRLLKAEVADVVPMGDDLDAELGVYDAEWDEVSIPGPEGLDELD